MSIYTKSERTVKKYTVGEAYESAKRALAQKGYKQVCTNAISKREMAEKITLEELNIIREAIICDTMFYG